MTPRSWNSTHVLQDSTTATCHHDSTDWLADLPQQHHVQVFVQLGDPPATTPKAPALYFAEGESCPERTPAPERTTRSRRPASADENTATHVQIIEKRDPQVDNWPDLQLSQCLRACAHLTRCPFALSRRFKVRLGPTILTGVFPACALNVTACSKQTSKTLNRGSH